MIAISLRISCFVNNFLCSYLKGDGRGALVHRRQTFPFISSISTIVTELEDMDIISDVNREKM
jgi:hypothetical protein